MLDVGIGMGYVRTGASAAGSDLTVDVRGKPRRARVVKRPIYKRED
jgi:glycine cleavage system aminomethyltransferase T